MKAFDEFKSAKTTFEHHCTKCEKCGQYSGASRDLPLLCYFGTQLYILMMDLKRKVPAQQLRMIKAA